MMASGKVIVLTGASSGIGAALARQLGEQGHMLVLGARRAAQLRQVAEPFGQNALAVVTDVCRRADVEALRDAALQRFGQVDVWVNNAGRGIFRTVLELSDADVDEMLTVNLKSALYGMQAIVPYFQQRGQGHLINISSFLGRIPFAGVRSIYSASKAALNSLTANLRTDLARSAPGVQVSLVMPGVVDTDFAASALGAPAGSAPMPGAQSPAEVAAVIAALIEHPAAEIYTNPANTPELVQRYYADVAAFEANMRR
jgi:short-subunit dehydrogenase